MFFRPNRETAVPVEEPENPIKFSTTVHVLHKFFVVTVLCLHIELLCFTLTLGQKTGRLGVGIYMGLLFLSLVLMVKWPKIAGCFMYALFFFLILWGFTADILFPVYPPAPFYTFFKPGDYFVVFCIIMFVVIQFGIPVIFFMRVDAEQKAHKLATEGSSEDEPEETPKKKFFKYVRLQ